MGLYGAGLYGAGPYGEAGIRMSFNPIRDEALIAKGGKTYIWSQVGLTSVSARIEDFAYRFDQVLIHSPAVITQDDINLTTNILTMGSLGDKRIVGVEAEVVTPDDVFVSIFYRFKRSNPFIQTSEIKLDKERGFAKFDVKGVEFKVNFRVENYTSLDFKKADIKYSFLDRRKRGS